jgi:hypothetical protein
VVDGLRGHVELPAVPRDALPVRRASEATIANVKQLTDDMLTRLPADQQALVEQMSRSASKHGVSDSEAMQQALAGMVLKDPTQYGTLFRGMPMTPDDIAKLLDTKRLPAEFNLPLSYNEDLSRFYMMKRQPVGHEAVLLRIRDADEAYSLVSDRLSMDLEEMLAPKGSTLELLDHSVENGHHVFDMRLARKPTEHAGWGHIANARSKADDLLAEKLDESLARAHQLPSDELVAASAAGDAPATAKLQVVSEAKANLAKSLESAADWRKLQAVVNKAEDVTDVAGKAMGVVGILKALAAGKAAFLVPGLALPAAAMAARKFVKDRGSQWLAKAANAMAKTESRLDDAALAVAEKARLPKNYGPAAEKAAVGVLGEPDWVGPLVEQATSDAAGNIPPPAKAAVQIGTYAERYKQLQEQTKELKDPKKRLDFIAAATADIAAEQPELAAALQQQLMGDVDYLLATAPPGFTPRTIGVSPRQKPAVPYHDKRVLVDRAEALNDPDAVLEALARGELNLDQWDTLRARRPKRYEAMRSRVLEYAMDNPELPFKRRLAIGAAFQLPADWSDLHLSEIQLLNQPPAAEQPAPPTAPLKDSSDMLATPSQKASL